MRAARIHAFGEELRIDDVPEPEPGDGEVLFEVRFAAVNPLDVWLTQGTVAGGEQPLPFVPGVEATGTVEGRTVMARGFGLGVQRDGFYRELAAVPAEAAIPVPDDVDPGQAAALGVAGATAWRLIGDVARVGAGDRVLVLGASGGVGSLVVQLAKDAGATVVGQTSNTEKAGFVEEMGADHVVVASAEDLEAAAAPLEPTVAFDPLGDGFTMAAIRALQPYGRLVLYGASAGPQAEMDLRTVYRKSVQLLTYSGTIEPEERIREAMAGALDALAGGRMRVPIDEVLPLEKAAEAHRRIEERRVRGKLVLAP